MEVFDQFGLHARQEPGNWYRSNNFPVRSKYSVPFETEFSERVIVRVEIKSKENIANRFSLMVSVPPITKVNKEFIYDRNLMIFEQIGEEHKYARKDDALLLPDSGFAESSQLKIVPDLFPIYYDQLTALSVPLPKLMEFGSEFCETRCH